MVELLAPAGSKESFFAAVENGANAVYLAGKMFGARAYASNFDNDTLAELIRYAHLRHVRVHVAVNTIIDNEELPKLRSYLQFLYEAGADAVLLQDLGAVKLARDAVPKLPLHASTQMTVHHISGVQALEELGFSRVVLSRELSLKEIRSICAHSRIEIECFVHGALCVCYSGQCLMSSMIGGRSGNRGKCAQPCRLPYTLVDRRGHDVLGDTAGDFLLSPRDLNTIDLIPRLMDAGVDSLKIEGRMKRPEYVATIVRAYRKAIDSHIDMEKPPVDEEDHDRLAQVFNRDFTTAYLEKRPGKYMMSDRRPNNRGLRIGRVTAYASKTGMLTVKLTRPLSVGDQVDVWGTNGEHIGADISSLYTSRGKSIEHAQAGVTVSFEIKGKVHMSDTVFKVYDKALMDEARRSYEEDARQKIPVCARVEARIGKPLRLVLTDDRGNTVWADTAYIAEPAKNRPLTEETVKKQINRLGTTAFTIVHLSSDIEDGLMMPVSELNNVRREAIAALAQQRIVSFERARRGALPKKDWHMPTGSPAPAPKPAPLMAAVDDIETLKAAIDAGADGILYGGETYDGIHLRAEDYRAAWNWAKERGVRIDFNTPRIVRATEEEEIVRLLESFRTEPPDALHVHHIGMAYLARSYLSVPLHADYSMTSYNAMTTEFLHSYGFSEATLSPELNAKQISRMAGRSALPLTVLAHGRLPLMISEYCAVGSFLGGLDGGTCSHPCRREKYFLRDRKGIDFPIETDQFCRMHICNAKTLSLLPYAARLMHSGISCIRIEGRGMTINELRKTVAAYKNALRMLLPLSAEQERMLRMQEGGNITRGHYSRGIL